MRTLLAALVCSSLVLLSVATPAPAHDPDKWYPVHWEAGRGAVGWRFDREFPRGDGIRRSLRKAARRWNALDQSMSFDFARGSWNGYAPRRCPARYQKNGIHWGSIDGAGGVLAYTFVCFKGDALRSFQMEFDRSEDWHRDPGSSPSLFENDMFGVAAHEFGHATGRVGGGPDGDGHFSDSSRHCPDIFTSDRHTMCPSTSGDGSARSLERHDRDVFRRRY